MVDGWDWDPAEGLISVASARWLTPSEMRSPYAAVRVMLKPCKDPDGKHKPVPLLIRRRQLPSVPRGADPVCAYDALAAAWDLDAAHVPEELRAFTPLFVVEPGVAVCTSDMRADARAIAEAAGLDPKEVGSTSFRIGGAEDYYDVLGPESATIITERGRWDSDISVIYKRCTATPHLAASAAIGDAAGISLEALGDGWANPGRRAPARR